jgi:hypothetical protein
MPSPTWSEYDSASRRLRAEQKFVFITKILETRREQLLQLAATGFIGDS